MTSRTGPKEKKNCVLFEPQLFRKNLCRNCFKTQDQHQAGADGSKAGDLGSGDLLGISIPASQDKTEYVQFENQPLSRSASVDSSSTVGSKSGDFYQEATAPRRSHTPPVGFTSKVAPPERDISLSDYGLGTRGVGMASASLLSKHIASQGDSNIVQSLDSTGSSIKVPFSTRQNVLNLDTSTALKDFISPTGVAVDVNHVGEGTSGSDHIGAASTQYRPSRVATSELYLSTAVAAPSQPTQSILPISSLSAETSINSSSSNDSRVAKDSPADKVVTQVYVGRTNSLGDPNDSSSQQSAPNVASMNGLETNMDGKHTLMEDDTHFSRIFAEAKSELLAEEKRNQKNSILSSQNLKILDEMSSKTAPPPPPAPSAEEANRSKDDSDIQNARRIRLSRRRSRQEESEWKRFNRNKIPELTTDDAMMEGTRMLIDNLKEKVTVLEDKCGKLEKEKVSLCELMSAKKREFEYVEDELKLKLSDLEDDIQRLTNEKNRLLDKLKLPESERESLKEQEAEIAKLNKRLEETVGKYEELEDENCYLKEEIRNLQLEMEEMHDQFREEDAYEFKVLQKELETTAKNCRILQFKVRKAERRNDELEADLQQYEEKIRRLEGGGSAEPTITGGGGQHVRLLEDELRSAKDMAAHLRVELSSVEEKRLLYEQELSRMNRLLTESESRRIALQGELESLKAQFHQTKDRPTSPSLTVPSSNTSTSVGKTAAIVNSDQQQQDVAQLLRDLAGSSERENDLREQLKFAEEKAKTLQKKVSGLEEESESLALQLEKMSAAKSGKYFLQAKPGEEASSDPERREEEIRLQMELAEQEVKVLRRKMEEMERENERLNASLAKLENRQQATGGGTLNEEKIKTMQEEIARLQLELEESAKKSSDGGKKSKHSRKLQKSLSLEDVHGAVATAMPLDSRSHLEVIEKEISVLREQLEEFESVNERLAAENGVLKVLVAGNAIGGNTDAQKQLLSEKLKEIAEENMALRDKIKASKERKRLKRMRRDSSRDDSSKEDSEARLSEPIFQQQQSTNDEDVCRDLRAKLVEQERLNNRLQGDLDRLRSDIQHSNKSSSDKSISEALQTKVDQMAKQIGDLEQDKAKVAVELKSNKFEVAELTAAYDQKEKSLQKELQDLAAKNQLVVDTLTLRAEFAQKEVERVKKELTTSHETTTEKLKKSVSSLESSLSEEKTKVKTLEKKLETSEKKNHSVAEAGLKDKLKEIETLKQELASNKQQLTTDKATVKDLTERLKQAQKQTDTLHSEHDKVNKELHEKRTKLESLEKKIKEKESSEAAAKLKDKEPVTWKFEKQEFEKQLKETKKKSEELQQEVKKLQGKIKSDDAEQLKKDTEKAKCDAEKAKSELQELKAKHEEMLSKIKKEKDDWLKEKRTLETDKTTAQKEVKQKESELKEKETVYKQIEDLLKHKDKEIIDREFSFKHKETDFIAKEKSLEQTGKDLIEMKKRLSLTDEKLQQLEKSAMEQEEKIKALNGDIQSRDHKLAEKEKHVDKLTKQLSEKEKLVPQIGKTSEKEKAASKIATASDQSSELKTLQTQIASLKSELDESENARKTAVKEAEKAVKEAKKIAKEVESAKAKESHWEQEKEKLLEEIKQAKISPQIASESSAAKKNSSAFASVAATRERDSLKSEKDKLITEMNILKKDVGDKTKQWSAAKEELENATKEKADSESRLSKEAATAKKEKEKLEQEVKQLKERISSAETGKGISSDGVFDKAHSEKLQKELTSLKKELQQQEKERTSEKEEWQKTIAEKTKQMEESAALCKRLHGDSSAAPKERKPSEVGRTFELEREKTKLAAELDKVKKDTQGKEKHWEVEKQSIQKTVAEKTKALDDSAATLKKLQAEIEDLKSKSVLATPKKTFEVSVTSLTAEKEALKAEKDKLLHELTDIKKDLAEKSKLWTVEREDLQKSLLEKSKIINESSAEHKRLQSEIDKLRPQVTSPKGISIPVVHEITRKAQELESAEKVFTLERDLSLSREQISNLQKENNSTTSFLLASKKTLAEFRELYEKGITERKEDTNKLKKKAKELEEKTNLIHRLQKEVEETKLRLQQEENKRREVENQREIEKHATAGTDKSKTSIKATDAAVPPATPKVSTFKNKFDKFELPKDKKATVAGQGKEQLATDQPSSSAGAEGDIKKLTSSLQKQIDELQKAREKEAKEVLLRHEQSTKETEKERSELKEKMAELQKKALELDEAQKNVFELKMKMNEDAESWLKEKRELHRRLEELSRLMTHQGLHGSETMPERRRRISLGTPEMGRTNRPFSPTSVSGLFSPTSSPQPLSPSVGGPFSPSPLSPSQVRGPLGFVENAKRTWTPITVIHSKSENPAQRQRAASVDKFISPTQTPSDFPGSTRVASFMLKPGTPTQVKLGRGLKPTINLKK